MSPVLPFDILDLIIDIVGENKDINLLKELSLVSCFFLQICSKHLFATIELHDTVHVPNLKHQVAKRGFVKLLKNRPDVVKYIRKLTYKIEETNRWDSPSFDNDEDILSLILPNFLRTIPRLNCLTITASYLLSWNSLNPSLTSAFLHLMHLPTLNHIDLSSIFDFPLSSFSSFVNLYRLDISKLDYVRRFEKDSSPEFVVQSEMMPKIREFRTSDSTLLTTKLLHAKLEDGRPAFNFADLRRLSMSFYMAKDESNIRYVLQNAKSLEELCLCYSVQHQSLVGLLSPSARTLKVLDLSVPAHSFDSLHRPLQVGGFCEELEAMAGHNMLEVLSCEVYIRLNEPKASILGSIIQNMEKVLVKPGWSALRQVSLKVSLREN